MLAHILVFRLQQLRKWIWQTDRHKSGALVLGIATAILLSAFSFRLLGMFYNTRKLIKKFGKIIGMIEKIKICIFNLRISILKDPYRNTFQVNIPPISHHLVS